MIVRPMPTGKWRQRLGAIALVCGAGLLVAGVVVIAGAHPRAPVAPPVGSATSLPASRAAGAVPGPVGQGPLAPKPLAAGTRVVIPSIGVDAAVTSLGLNADGTLEVPTDFSTAGWWSGGPFPGQPGPAVVVGHVESVAGPGAFYRLGQLSPGDLVSITKAGGWKATFAVTRLVRVAKDAFPTLAVYGPVAGSKLRLVTCTGAFDPSSGHFVDNLVVFASLVSVTG